MSSDILDYTFGPLLKTGQTTDYTPAGRTTKDDGGLQRGINQSLTDAQYVILTTGQYAGTTNITVNGKTDTHSNECVFDKVTSLMWSRTNSAGVFGTGAEHLLWDDSGGSNEDIFEYCDQANSAGLAGYSDWRVPNRTELESLCKHITPSSFPNAIAFPVMANNQWTATTRGGLTTTAYSLSFNAGNISSITKTTTRFPVLLCRLGIEHQ